MVSVCFHAVHTLTRTDPYPRNTETQDSGDTVPSSFFYNSLDGNSINSILPTEAI